MSDSVAVVENEFIDEEYESRYIEDYITGIQVLATKEEVYATQVFSKILVEDYGYPKEVIQTRPQFRVKASPSDKSYKYPVDIAVFSNENKNREDVMIVVECKKPTREDGLEQLKHYLEFSRATIGVWFNGSERLYIRKYYKDGQIFFDDTLVNIPRYGQRVEDIGLYTKKDLKKTHNLKSTFIAIRNYLSGNAVGVVRDEEYARQIINIILCKLYDEKYTKDEDILTFRAGVNESHKDVAARIKKRFNEAKKMYKDVLTDEDKITLDDSTLTYVVGELQGFALMNAERDVIGDAFEVFIHRSLKGSQGQFFTPKNIVKAAIKILDPGIDDRIIDPSCGSGGFIVEALKYVHDKIDIQGKALNWPIEAIEAEKMSKINLNIRGIERDSFLSKVAKAYMVLMGDGKSGVFCEDSLKDPNLWKQETQVGIQLGAFDIVVNNPPFGAKIPVKGEAKLSQFNLGYKWKKNKKTNKWEKEPKIRDKQSPQILFIERCLQLLKEGGKLAIVLPDGVLSNPTDRYIVQYLLEHTELIGLIDLPMSTFLPYTPTKTHLLFAKKTKNPRNDYEFFMSYAKTCGHDKRGKDIKEDEIEMIVDYISKIDTLKEYNHLGFKMNISEVKNNILLPKYYNPDILKQLKEYESTNEYELKTIGELVREGILTISRGNEVGSENYGTGDIPFVRTSEIANWEIVTDCTQCISEEIYNQYKAKQNLQKEDILIINDGTYLMGRAAMITDLDIKCVIQSHFRILRVLDADYISPYTLLALLGLEIVQKQIESKCFRQGTISTLGDRLLEVVLPIPVNQSIKDQISKDVERVISQKRECKEKVQNYKLLGKNENLMGIKNKAKLGNL